MAMKGSIFRKVDKKFGVPKEERGVCGSRGGDRGLEFSKRRKGQTSFLSLSLSLSLSTFLSLSHIKLFFSLSLEVLITQQHNSA